jgi:hypothetical protein
VILKYLNRKFSSLCRLKGNISHDESHTHWKARLGFKQYIPLKAVFMLLCTDTHENLLCIVGNTIDLTSSGPGYSLGMSKIVVKLVEPLFAEDTHWVGGQFLHFTRFLSSSEEKSFKCT